MLGGIFFFFKQKTAYEMRISDWSSDVCSSDLSNALGVARRGAGGKPCLCAALSRFSAFLAGAEIVDAGPAARVLAGGENLRFLHLLGPRGRQAVDEQQPARRLEIGQPFVAPEIGRAHV